MPKKRRGIKATKVNHEPFHASIDRSKDSTLPQVQSLAFQRFAGHHDAPNPRESQAQPTSQRVSTKKERASLSHHYTRYQSTMPDLRDTLGPPRRLQRSRSLPASSTSAPAGPSYDESRQLPTAFISTLAGVKTYFRDLSSLGDIHRRALVRRTAPEEENTHIQNLLRRLIKEVRTFVKEAGADPTSFDDRFRNKYLIQIEDSVAECMKSSRRFGRQMNRLKDLEADMSELERRLYELFGRDKSSADEQRAKDAEDAENAAAEEPAGSVPASPDYAPVFDEDNDSWSHVSSELAEPSIIPEVEPLNPVDDVPELVADEDRWADVTHDFPAGVPKPLAELSFRGQDAAASVQRVQTWVNITAPLTRNSIIWLVQTIRSLLAGLPSPPDLTFLESVKTLDELKRFLHDVWPEPWRTPASPRPDQGKITRKSSSPHVSVEAEKSGFQFDDQDGHLVSPILTLTASRRVTKSPRPLNPKAEPFEPFKPLSPRILKPKDCVETP